MTPLEELKLIIREKDYPYFTDDELSYYLTKYSSNVKRAAYDCLILKSQNTSMTLSGLTLPETSNFFLRLANQYRPSNSGILKGGY